MSNADLYLPSDYVRQEPVFWNDFTVPEGVVWQQAVYETAFAIAADHGDVPIVDVGCGNAQKLIDRIDAERITGIDAPQTVAQLARLYPLHNWISDDFEDPQPIDAEGKVVICADVLEHLWNPRNLLDVLASSGAIAIVLSTPDRELARGADHLGPCPHAPHAQEWTCDEFTALVNDFMKVSTSQLVQSSSLGPEAHTIMVVAA